MSKKTIIILIILCSPITIFIVGRLTGIFTIFTIKTLSGYPNLQPHDAIITTSLSTPKRGDIIVFKQLTRPEYGLSYNVYRLIADEGDVLEIKNGECFVNNISIDKNLDLAFPYETPTENQDFFYRKYPLNKDIAASADSLTMIYLSNREAQNLPKDIAVKRLILPKGEIQQIKGQLWGDSEGKFNVDNYGPVKIPKGSCFVMGDNRHLSDDSRFWGLVDKNNIKGVFVTKSDALSWIYRKLGI